MDIANIDPQIGTAALGHEVFVNEVKPHLNHLAPMAGIYQNAPAGSYRIDGKKLVFAADLYPAPPGMGTRGQLPEHQYVDLVTLETTPARAFLRKKRDNFQVARGKGPGVFEDYETRERRQELEGWERMVTFHVHGSSAATLAVVDAVADTTHVTLKDGYGHPGTNPLMHIGPNQIVAVLDASNGYAVLGATTLAGEPNFETKGVVFATAIAGMATGDLLVRATTTNTAAEHFITERGWAPLGCRDIIDPDENNASYLGKAEATYPRLKPVRMDSADWGEIEFVEFKARIRANGGTPVRKDSHVFSCQEGIVLELAKTLLGYRQAPMDGMTLTGGWESDLVNVAGHAFLIDDYHTPDELMAHCLEDLYAVDLNGAANEFSEDGSVWSRLEDWDAMEKYRRHYFQRFADRRNRMGVLRDIPNPYADTLSAGSVGLP
jgi:hypothetical protein